MHKTAHVLSAFSFLVLLVSPSAFAQEEEKLTITTYYPSSTGVYQTLKVFDKAEFNMQRQGQHNHVVIHGAGPAQHYGVLSFSAYNGASDVNTAGVWGFIESNTTGTEAGGLMFASKSETDTVPVSRVTMNRVGNVGLGVYPAAKLHINATSGHQLLLQQNDNTTPNQYIGQRWRSGGREGYIWVANDVSTSWGGAGSMNIHTSNGNITFRPNAIEMMRIATNGNVGIGTNNPVTRLHVSGNSDVAARITSTHTAMAGSPSMYMGMNAGNNAGLIELTAGKDFKLWNGQYALTVNGTTGNVGIGTTTPTEKLIVNGTVKMGTNGSLFGASGDEKIRIVRGSVQSDGSILRGSGFTVSHSATGKYNINFITAFSAAPSVTATWRTTASTTDRDVYVESAAASGVVIDGLMGSGASFADVNFDFIAVGPP